MILSPNFSNKSMNFGGAKFAVYARLKLPAASCRECSALRQCFAATVRNPINFLIRSLTPQPRWAGFSLCYDNIAGNALAVQFRKSVLILAALIICLSGCTTVRDPVIRVINESSVIDINRPVAVLPVYNLSGTPTPLSDIRQSLIESLKKRGLNTLEAEVLQRFMAKYRIRYTGGIDGGIAKAFRKEVGVETVLITSLELYSEVSPPKVAMTSRLVSTGNNPSILWIKGIGLAGDDSPGILGLALIEDPQILLKMAVQNITASLAEYLSDQRYGIGPPPKTKKVPAKGNIPLPYFRSRNKTPCGGSAVFKFKRT